MIDDVLAEILPDCYNLSSGKAIKVVFAVVLYEVVLGFILSGLSSALNQGCIDITTKKDIMIGHGNSPYKYLMKCNIQYLGLVHPKEKFHSMFQSGQLTERPKETGVAWRYSKQISV